MGTATSLVALTVLHGNHDHMAHGMILLLPTVWSVFVREDSAVSLSTRVVA